MPPAYFDNIAILKAIDERQQQMNGRPLHLNAHSCWARCRASTPRTLS
jgi:hypothetical protein